MNFRKIQLMNSIPPDRRKEFREKAAKYCLRYGLIEKGSMAKGNILYRLILVYSKLSLKDDVLAFLDSALSKHHYVDRTAKGFNNIRLLSKTDRVSNETFFASREWFEARYQVLKRYGSRCQCCGALAADGTRMHVDHIKPRSKFPELQLELSNLQVLCEECNLGKGAWDETDWRKAK